MPINLMYITNNTLLANTADEAGVDEIFIDLEIHGKEERQSGRSTVISRHKVEDISRIRSVLRFAKVLVRCNPVGAWTENEVDDILAAGADTVMLPYFKHKNEVELFLECVAGRAKTCLLVETIEALEGIESILSVDGIDRMHIGLNDLHIAYKSSFIFEPFANGRMEKACAVASRYGVDFGIGGISSIGSGLKPSPECLLAEHMRLGSTSVILSRSFFNPDIMGLTEVARSDFAAKVREIRRWEKELNTWDNRMFVENRSVLISDIEKIARDNGK